MVLTTSISCVLLVALLLHFLLIAEKRLILGPESLFLMMGTGSFVATLLAAVDAGEFSHPYVRFIGVGLILFILGTATSACALRFQHRKTLQAYMAKPWIFDLQGLQFHVLIAVGAVSVAITTAYFYSLGFLVPHEALRVLLASGVEGMQLVYNELRRATSATGNYLAPGYVFQFKNCLLPLVTIVLFFWTRIKSSSSTRFVFLLFLVATGLAAVGTGARFAFASAAAAFIFIGIAPFMAPFRLTRLHTAIAAVATLLALSGLTLMMGARGQEKLVDRPLLWAPLQVLDRVFASPAQERYDVYELYLKHEEPQWGKGVLTELEIILPGRQYYTLSNELHELLYGSAAGNVGLDVWGSLWYDFQWYGLVAIFFYGFICHSFYIWILRGPKRFIRVITLTYAGTVLGLATELQVLILRGFLTCLILLGLINCARYLERVLVAYRRQVPETSPVTSR